MTNPLPFDEVSYDDKSASFTQSFMIFAKLFAYYPLKYTILVFIFFIIIKILNYVYKYGEKAYKKFKKFVEILMDLGTLNLIIFKIPNFFRLASGILDLVIGFGYFFIALLFFILAVICMIPFNAILPYYNSIL